VLQIIFFFYAKYSKISWLEIASDFILMAMVHTWNETERKRDLL
jgi:hypothetical protein